MYIAVGKTGSICAMVYFLLRTFRAFATMIVLSYTGSIDWRWEQRPLNRVLFALKKPEEVYCLSHRCFDLDVCGKCHRLH